MTEKEKPKKRTGANVIFDALKKVGVIKSEDDLTPEMLQLMKETNEAKALLQKEQEEVDVKTIYPTLSENAQILLIAMVHPSEEVGAIKELIIATSLLEDSDLDNAITELRQHHMWEQGKLVEGRFVPGEGHRHRLPNSVKQQVIKDILKLPTRGNK